LPRGFERINKTITGLGGTAQGHTSLPAVFIDDATRDRLLPATAVVLTSVVITPSHTAARTLPHGHRRFPIAAHALAPSRCRGVGLFFLMLAKIAAGSLLFFWGVAVTTWRRRKPLRCSTAASVEGAGSWSSLSPWALSPANAPWAVRRV
jgi:hypothetical protein